MYESSGEIAHTAFRKAEKKYQLHKDQIIKYKNGKPRGKKLQVRPTDDSDVLDLLDEAQLRLDDGVVKAHSCSVLSMTVYSFPQHPGLYVVPGALLPEQQRKLIVDALTLFPQPPNHTNFISQYGMLPSKPSLWEAAHKDLYLQQGRAKGAPVGTACGSGTSNDLQQGPHMHIAQDQQHPQQQRQQPLHQSLHVADSRTEQRCILSGQDPCTSALCQLASLRCTKSQAGSTCEAGGGAGRTTTRHLPGQQGADARYLFTAQELPAPSQSLPPPQVEKEAAVVAATVAVPAMPAAQHSPSSEPPSQAAAATAEGVCGEQGEREGSGTLGVEGDRGRHDAGQSSDKCWVYRQNSTPGECVAARKLLRKLRWATLGPPFDWTQRVYRRDVKYNALPQSLADLAIRLAGAVAQLEEGGQCEGGSTTSRPRSFQPDVALVNYYYEGDTLGGHVDDAELDLHQPIVTLSLGCEAVFLAGGLTRDAPPLPLLLRSGDAVVMAGESRRSYHGIPRIFCDRPLPACLLEDAPCPAGALPHNSIRTGGGGEKGEQTSGGGQLRCGGEAARSGCAKLSVPEAQQEQEAQKSAQWLHDFDGFAEHMKGCRINVSIRAVA